MSIFDGIKGGLKKVFKPEVEAPQKVNNGVDETIEQNREKGDAMDRKIIVAIDHLLYAMGSAKRFPMLGEEDLSRYAETLKSMQHQIGGTHSDCDITELDANILALVESVEGQMAQRPAEDWKEMLVRLGKAVLARSQEEYEIRAAALDIAQLLLQNTNAAWEWQIGELVALREKATWEDDKRKLNQQISGIQQNIDANKKRLGEIDGLFIQLRSTKSSPSPETLRGIDGLLSSIRAERPVSMRIAKQNIEAMRNMIVENNVITDEMAEVNEMLQATLAVAEAQGVSQPELDQVARTVAKAAEPEAEQVAE